ncbi:MAG: FtsQ-type POTRA domain-containing protein [Gemmatimonadetes bacterium]|nr:FtsQ-type POTRA domain-containing protein [Gemmatimonadota bacterium]
MRRGLRLVVVTALTLAAGAGAVRLQPMLVELELFQVRDVRLEGGHHLAAQEAVAAAAVPADASVWDDAEPWEAALERHPLVKDARVRRRLPSTLVLEVEERVPVALLPTPTLEPVDAEGRLLPIDPALHRLDLPVVRLAGHAGRGGRRPPAGWAPHRIRHLTAELERLSIQDPAFVQELAVLSARADGEVEAMWGEGGVRLVFRAPLTPRRLQEARAALADAGRRFPERTARDVDLRFADQVVVRFDGAGR